MTAIRTHADRCVLIAVLAIFTLALPSAPAQASQVAFLRPNADVTAPGSTAWIPVGSSSFAGALNDVVVENQTPNAADYAAVSGTVLHAGKEPVEVEIATISLSSLSIQEAKAWYYTSNGNELEASIKDAAGSTLASMKTSSAGWHSFSISLNGSQAQLDGLRMRFRVIKGSPVPERRILAAFVKLRVELPASQHLTHIGISADSRSAVVPGNVQNEVLETGATRIREDIEWDQIEPINGEWTWGNTDSLFEEAAERGLTILPILNSPPCWAVPVGAEPCEHSYPESDLDFAYFTARVVERYGIGGDFWEAHPELDAELAPKYFEIWNEPYIPVFVNEEVDPARYADLYSAAVAAGRTANPKSRYLIEATWKYNPQGSSEQLNWAQGIYEQNPAIGSLIDGIAIHPYPGNRDVFYQPGAGIAAAFRNTDRIYAYWRDSLKINKPIWITEVGYSSCTDEEDCVPGGSQSAREEIKSEWLSDLFDVVNRGNYPYVHAVYLYNLRQWLSPESPTSVDSDWFGIRDGSGPLPAWAAFTNAVAAYGGTPLPNTTITNVKNDHGARFFTFAVSDPTAGSECQLDAGAWSSCASPKTYGSIGTGHTFRVRGVSAEGPDPTPASYSW